MSIPANGTDPSDIRFVAKATFCLALGAVYLLIGAAAHVVVFGSTAINWSELTQILVFLAWPVIVIGVALLVAAAVQIVTVIAGLVKRVR